jgi:chitosanase
MNTDTKNTIIKILNCFETGSQETDYSSIFIWNDGPNNKPQVTLGRGFTECGGSLWMVFERYEQLAGKNAKMLLAYKRQSCTISLPKNKDFLNLISDSSDDPSFREAQDYIYDKVYWSKGNEWANRNGFELPISHAVIQDSFLQSGSILGFLRNRFGEKLPSAGGNELKWIEQYLTVRDIWLAGHSRKILRNTVYRPRFFIKQIRSNNVNLDKFPIFPNGVKISS